VNFSLPKLSAVALLSLFAGFGASMWLNATESEGPGDPDGPVAGDKCKYVHKGWSNVDTTVYKNKHQQDPPTSFCTDCTSECAAEGKITYKGENSRGTEVDIEKTGTATTKTCTTCP
jgi:hypothetical protein